MLHNSITVYIRHKHREGTYKIYNGNSTFDDYRLCQVVVNISSSLPFPSEAQQRLHLKVKASFGIRGILFSSFTCKMCLIIGLVFVPIATWKSLDIETTKGVSAVKEHSAKKNSKVLSWFLMFYITHTYKIINIWMKA